MEVIVCCYGPRELYTAHVFFWLLLNQRSYRAAQGRKLKIIMSPFQIPSWRSDMNNRKRLELEYLQANVFWKNTRSFQFCSHGFTVLFMSVWAKNVLFTSFTLSGTRFEQCLNDRKDLKKKFPMPTFCLSFVFIWSISRKNYGAVTVVLVIPFEMTSNRTSQ